MTHASFPVVAERGLWGAAMRGAILALLLLAYRLSFWSLFGWMETPAFLFGLIPCLLGAVLFGVRGALVMVLVVAVIDRGFALQLTGPETSLGAGGIALSAKLLLAGSLGLVVDSRRRVNVLNAQLLLEIETRKQREESLRRSEELHRALLAERVASERRQRDLERELRRSQSLESLAVMAGGVAHDFNNLLCGVVGNAEVAQRKVPAGAPPVLSQCLSEIIAFAGEAAQLSKQMLAYAGQRSPGIEALDANLELTAALRLLHAAIESRARLATDLSKGLPEVAADRSQLRQVITNLVLNGLDAMESGRGVLTLRSVHVKLDPSQAATYELGAGDYVKVTVQDTGSGISAQARERMFEPFFSTKAAGRGMGLAAAAGIVRAHRGWLGVERTSEQGTTFAILLPVARDTTPRRSPRQPGVAAPPAPRRILLIDDEPAVRVVTSRLLGELGQQVVTADSGQRGLELFREQPDEFELIVLDLTMPERSGAQVLEELRLIRDDVPVVITSGFQAADASRLLCVSNVVGFLDKPHTLSDLELILASAERAPPSVGAVAAAS